MTGVDLNYRAGETFRKNRVGEFLEMDLAARFPDARSEIVVGGPPCRPWSVLNVQKRRQDHPDYRLLDRYFRFVGLDRPVCFIMENVMGLGSDPNYLRGLRTLGRRGYAIGSATVRYSDWGAATARHRLFTYGFSDIALRDRFASAVEAQQREPRSVMSAIERFASIPKDGCSDHVWPELRTIDRYAAKYRTSSYGWYQPDPAKPAPSFGNIVKTYILHPWAGKDGFPLRVISIREAMAIMGFPASFRFPQGLAMRVRYQMVADAVSPVYSRVLARAINKALA